MQKLIATSRRKLLLNYTRRGCRAVAYTLLSRTWLGTRLCKSALLSMRKGNEPAKRGLATKQPARTLRTTRRSETVAELQ